MASVSASALYKKAEEVFKSMRMQANLAECYGNQALILQDWGRLDEAMILHDQEEAIFEPLKHKRCLRNCYKNKGDLFVKMNKKLAGLAYLKKSLELAIALKHPDYEKDKEGVLKLEQELEQQC